MRRPTSVEPFTPKPVALHPGLIAALDNLDVQLDDELERFRRQRFRQTGKKPVDRLDETRMLDSTVEALSRFPHLQQQLSPQFREQLQPQFSQPQLFSQSQVFSQPQVQSQPRQPMPYAEPSLEPEEIEDVWDAPPGPAPSLTTFDARRVVREMRSPQPEITESYLASSKELIRNLSQPEPPTPRQPTLLDTLLTPMGVGSMLLLLLSSVSLGYLLMNPANLGFLTAIGRAPAPSDGTFAPGSQSLSPDLAADEFVDVNLNTLSQLPRHGRPATVVTLPKTASPTVSPTASPEAAVPPPPVVSRGTIQTVTIPAAPPPAAPARSAPARVSTPSQPARAATPARPAPAPAQPAAAAPAAATAPAAPTVTVRIPPPPQIMPSLPQSAAAPSLATPPGTGIAHLPPSSTISQAPPSGDRYYVVTDYTGDPSLSQARQAVNDAYVRNFDDGSTKVQMGAFVDAASAQGMAQRLQQQGVPAQVYKP
jgi:hypothetical protein